MTSGHLRKMKTHHETPVRYELCLGDEAIELNSFLGRTLRLEYTGSIRCIACGRPTKKSYAQGHCFRCMQTLASCDLCIVRPEKCHYDQGTCREPAWGEANCLQPHTVYLARSAGVKVGITHSAPHRWMDQGAVEVLPIMTVRSRFQSGLVEIALGAHVGDKTDWRKMLRNEVVDADLIALRDDLFDRCADELEEIDARFGHGSIEKRLDAEPIHFSYPILEHPRTIRALNLDKTPLIEDRLLGIKGQYLILGGGVVNIRKYQGYELRFSVE